LEKDDPSNDMTPGPLTLGKPRVNTTSVHSKPQCGAATAKNSPWSNVEKKVGNSNIEGQAVNIR